MKSEFHILNFIQQKCQYGGENPEKGLYNQELNPALEGLLPASSSRDRDPPLASILGAGIPLLGGAGLGAFQDVPVSKGLSMTHVPPPTEGPQSLSPTYFYYLNLSLVDL